MDRTENWRRAVRFERPERAPMVFHINPSCWHHWSPAEQHEVQGLMAAHPWLFPGFAPQPVPVRPGYAPNARAATPCRDRWGCTWETSDDGIVGAVTRHALADWSAHAGWQPPDPTREDSFGDWDWTAYRDQVAEAHRRGELCVGSLEHGHTFLRLCDLHGYEGLLCDMSDDDPRLPRLVEQVEAFNLERVRRFVAAQVGAVAYPEDLGMQVGPMLSPRLFRRWIKPSYQRLMAPARAAGLPVHMHSDGDIRSLAADLIDGGVEVLNLQDLVNGLDWIAANLKGRVCIDLDIDRQRITPFGTPAEIDRHVHDVIAGLGSREGGLTMIYGLYPGVPLANVAALMDAMERYAGMHAG
jgi:hypothetical protein